VRGRAAEGRDGHRKKKKKKSDSGAMLYGHIGLRTAVRPHLHNFAWDIVHLKPKKGADWPSIGAF